MPLEINSPSQDRFVEKAWGTEEIIVNKPGYCGKILRINPGFQCSLHYHIVKDESFLCTKGPVFIQVGEEVGELNEGDSVDIPVGTPHRFGLRETDDFGVLVEFSTSHSDDDVVRLEPSGPTA